MGFAAGRCLSDEDVACILEGGPRPLGLDAHLDRCEACFSLLAVSARETAASDPAQPARIADRYQLRDVLGEGGMGRVLLAHDSVLDRSVALKIVRSEVFGVANLERARDRMKEEARLMAGITHPNIVHVYDVGEASGGIFIAMEYVHGMSLDVWIRRESPSEAAIINAFGGAARGLAAAHALGIVHRDVKPSNLLIDDAHHVRVTDFGLARAIATADTPPLMSSGLSGTVGYMAPEQARGGAVSPAVDQYALGLAALGALAPGAPIVVDDVRAALQDPARPWPTPCFEGAPRRAVPTLRRATALDPADRFPTIESFAVALEACSRGPRGLLPMAVMLGVSVVGIALAPTPAANPCDQIDREIDVHWNAATREGLTASLAEARQPDAFVNAVVEALDRHAATWRTAAPQVCALARSRGPVSGAPRMACLDGRREALATYIESLSTPNAQVLDRAPSALAHWNVLDCMRSAPVGPDLASLDQAEARQLDRAMALFRMGRLEDAEHTLPETSADDPSLLRARSAVVRGSIARERNEPGRAQEFYFAALLDALRLDDPMTEIQARLGLADTDLTLEGQTQRARAELQQATTLLAQHEHPDLQRDAALLWVDVFMLEDKPRRALEHLEARFSLDDAQAPLDPPTLEAMSRRVGLLVAVGRYADAVESGRATADRTLQTLGDLHPMLARAKTELSIALVHVGALDAALDQAQQAVTLLGTASSADTFVRGLGDALNALGMTHWRREELDDARRAFERSLASTDPRSPGYGITLDNLGTVLLHRGEVEAAEMVHRRAIEVLSAVRGQDNFEVALAYNNLGEALFQQQRYSEAYDAFSDGLRRNERARGLEHPENAAMLMGLGKALMKRQRYADAVAPLRRAVAIREAHPQDRQFLGVTRYALAIALWRGSGDVAEATVLVHKSAADFEAADLPTGDLERARTWLAAHAGKTQ